jgi:hypothetical protein
MGFTHRGDDKLDPASETFAVKFAVNKKWVIAGWAVRTVASDKLNDRGR